MTIEWETRRFRVGDRVTKKHDGRGGVVTATSYPGWIDWRPDDRREPGVETTDPGNLALANRPQPVEVPTDLAGLIGRLRYAQTATDMAIYGDIEVNIGETCREAADALGTHLRQHAGEAGDKGEDAGDLVDLRKAVVRDDGRTLAQFFFEIGFGACFAKAMIANDMRHPFEFSDAMIEAEWPRSIEAHDDPEEIDTALAAVDALPALLDELGSFRATLANTPKDTATISTSVRGGEALFEAAGSGDALRNFGALIFDTLWDSFTAARWEIEVNDLITETAAKAGLVKSVDFDPDQHDDPNCACVAGDDFYLISDAGRKALKLARALSSSKTPNNAGEGE